jgi:hypothetical protein
MLPFNTTTTSGQRHQRQRQKSSSALVLLLCLLPSPAHGFFAPLSYIFGNDFLLFPRIQCLLALYLRRFDISDFASYGKVFRDDSIMELAQTGTYQGKDAIEEYVKFTFPGYNPFFRDAILGTEFEYRYSAYRDGECVFLGFDVTPYLFDPDLTTALPDYISLSSMGKYYFNFRDRYFRRINIFYPVDALRVVFDVALNSNRSRDYVCGIIHGPLCGPILAAANNTNSTVTDCPQSLANLPVADGVDVHVDGQSQGCRALHSAFAATNAIHCPHISFAPLADARGAIKCQHSNLKSPRELFADSDFRLFRDFLVKHHVDPVLGHNCTLDACVASQ